MNVKEAATVAISHVTELFEQEQISNVGLEEIEFDYDQNEWLVTVGFSRPWDYPQGALAAALSPDVKPKRSFKVLRIREVDKKVISIRNRQDD